MKDIITLNTSDISDIKKPIKVYARVRPLNEDEIEREEKLSVETFDDEKRIKVVDKKHSQETTYHFDGVFGGHDSNMKVYEFTTRPLLTKLLNGINCAVLTYGQTGSGKTYTVMADGCITEFAIKELFDKIQADRFHQYKIHCSFVQIYLEKVYDLLSPENKDELAVREHPKKGIYVSNLKHQNVETLQGMFDLLQKGKEELVTAETNMVRQSSRSHSIFQISIERKLDTSSNLQSKESSKENDVQKTLPEDIMMLDEDMALKAKMDICDLAGSERLGKTLVEGINRVEARYINSSLLELGNVINSLSKGKNTHVPFRNSTLTRLLQECLGSKCLTSFIVCVAPSASESYETRCSLNFGARARTITNKERIVANIEIDYKLLAKKLSKRIIELESGLNITHNDGNNICSYFQNDTFGMKSNHGITRKDRQSQHLSSDLNHTIVITEMVDSIIEAQEEETRDNIDIQESQSNGRVSNILNVALTRLVDIQKHVSHDDDKVTSSFDDSVNEVLCESIDKLKVAHQELNVINPIDAKDLFRETAYTISETCTDIENILWDSLKSFSVTSTKIANNRHSNSFYKVVQSSLEDLQNSQNDLSKEMVYTKQLFYILQLLQLVRLFMETSSSKAEIPMEEMFSASSTTNYSGISTKYDHHISSHCNTYVDSEDSSVIDKDSPIIEEEPRNPSNKLFRSDTFKVKEYEAYRASAATKKGGSYKELSSPEEDQQYIFEATETTKHQYEFDNGEWTPSCSLDEMHTFADRFTDESSTLKDEYRELHGKYKHILKENEYLSNTNHFLEQNKEDLSRKVEASKHELDDLINEGITKNHYDYNSTTMMYNKLYYEENYDSYHSGDEHYHDDNRQQTFEDSVRDTSDMIDLLESENKMLLTERDNLKNKQGEMDKLLQETIGYCSTHEGDKKEYGKEHLIFIEQILELCNTLDVVKDLEETRKNKNPITQDELSLLETELFSMIEQNVQLETTLLEIRLKVGKQKEHENLRKDIKITSGNTEKEQRKCGKKQRTVLKSIASRPPAHITQKVNDMKKIQRKRVQSARKASNDQPATLGKEIKTCRVARIKDLVQNKLQMNERINKLEEELRSKELQNNNLKTNVELLVKELGQMDIESMDTGISMDVSLDTSKGLKRNGTFVRCDKQKENKQIGNVLVGSNEKIDIIPIPEVQYDDLLAFVRSGNNTACSSIVESKQSDVEVFNGTYEMYQQKDAIGFESARMNLILKEYSFHKAAMQQTITNLQESNSTFMDEIKLVKSINCDRKTRIKELTNEKNLILRNFEQLKHDSSQVQTKQESTRLKLEKQVIHVKNQATLLEKQNVRLRSELKKYREKGKTNTYHTYTSDSSDSKFSADSSSNY